MNDCVITLLPQNSCAHCTGAQPIAKTPSYERADYVETSWDRPRQDDPQPEQFTDQVTMADIHGEHQALRLGRK